MRFSSLLGASLMALSASAQNSTNSSTPLPPINLGYLSYPHGNQFMAWTLPTPTTPLKETCDTRGAGVNGTATWTSIRAYDTYVTKPICRNPFNVSYEDFTTGRVTTFFNLELACEDDDIALQANPVVTAVVDVATNKTVESCSTAPVPSPTGGYVSCTSAGEGLTWSFACS